MREEFPRPLSELLGESRYKNLFSLVLVYREDDKWILEGPSFVRDFIFEEERNIKQKIGDFVFKATSRSTRKTEKEVQSIEVHRTGAFIGMQPSCKMSPSSFVVASNNEKAWNFANELIDSGSGALLIYGPSGVGKTHLIHAVSWLAFSDGKVVAFFTSGELIDLISEAFKRKEVSVMKHMLNKADVLVIDDFQMFNARKFRSYHAVIFEILDLFDVRSKKVIITSDVKPEMLSYIPDRIKQRISTFAVVSMSPPTDDFVRKFVYSRLSNESKSITDGAINMLLNFKFSSVRDLDKVVTYATLVSKDKRVIDEAIVIDAVSSVLGFSMLRSERGLKDFWIKALKKLFDPYEVDAILVGQYSSLSLKVKKTLKDLKTSFCAVARQKGYRVVDIASALGISRKSVYDAVSRHEQRLKDPDYMLVLDVIKSVFGGNNE